MRHDMARVVTERPRRGHGNPSKKWGRRLRQDEFGAEDHGPARAPIAREHQYGWHCKEFSDVLGPLRRYLHTQVGRPWDKVWSDLTRNLDHRSLTGRHIVSHVMWDVERNAWLGADGRVYHRRRSHTGTVSGLYVHPRTGLLCHAPEPWRGHRGGPFVKARALLRAFGIQASSAMEIRRYRVDGTRVWERRDCGWFIHTYRYVPDQVVRSVIRSDGRNVSITRPAHYERSATKQANRKEIRSAQGVLDSDPLARA
jgi:hypothetical protein